MKIVFFILVLCMQVHAVEKCAQYFEAIAELKVLSLETKGLRTAFSKSLMEEPGEDAILKIAEAFHVSPDEVKADIANHHLKVLDPSGSGILEPGKYKKQYEIELPSPQNNILGLYEGHMASKNEANESTQYIIFDPSGVRLNDYIVGSKEKYSNKLIKNQLLFYPENTQISHSGMDILKAHSATQLVVKNLVLDLPDKFYTIKNKLVQFQWGKDDSHIITIELANDGGYHAILYEITVDDRLVPLKERPLVGNYEELIPSPDFKKVLLLRKAAHEKFDRVTVWDISSGDLKHIRFDVPEDFNFTRAHFTSANKVVLSNDLRASVYNSNGLWKAVHAGRINALGDYVFMTTGQESELLHFETTAKTQLPDNLTMEQVSFSLDEEKLYVLRPKSKIVEVWVRGLK